MSILFSPVFAEENTENTPKVFVDTDKLEYEIGDFVTISGLVEEKKMPVVALRIYDPNGSIISANQIDLEDDDTSGMGSPGAKMTQDGNGNVKIYMCCK